MEDSDVPVVLNTTTEAGSRTVGEQASQGGDPGYRLVCQARGAALELLVPAQRKQVHLSWEQGMRFWLCKWSALRRKMKGSGQFAPFWHFRIKNGQVLGRDILVLRFLFTCCQILLEKNRSVTKAD